MLGNRQVVSRFCEEQPASASNTFNQSSDLSVYIKIKVGGFILTIKDLRFFRKWLFFKIECYNNYCNSQSLIIEPAINGKKIQKLITK